MESHCFRGLNFVVQEAAPFVADPVVNRAGRRSAGSDLIFRAIRSNELATYDKDLAPSRSRSATARWRALAKRPTTALPLTKPCFDLVGDGLYVSLHCALPYANHFPAGTF